MARIRSVHPGQWTDEDFVQCSAESRLFAIALRNEADDYGAFEWKPITLKMRLMPMDNIDIPSLLKELEKHNQIMRLEIDGKAYGYIRNFCEFQKTKAPRHLYPMSRKTAEYVGVKYEDIPKHFRNASEALPAGIGNIVKGNGKGNNSAREPELENSKRIRKLEDLTIDDELRDLADQENRDADRELQKFRDYHQSGNAKRPLKDYRAGFRNWLRSDFGKPSKPKQEILDEIPGAYA